MAKKGGARGRQRHPARLPASSATSSFSPSAAPPAPAPKAKAVRPPSTSRSSRKPGPVAQDPPKEPAKPEAATDVPALPTPAAHLPAPPPQAATSPAAGSVSPPVSLAPTGRVTEEETGPKPEADAEPEESELEAIEQDEDDQGGESPPVEARAPRPKGVAPELPLRVESVLFAASKPVTVHELVGRLGGEVDHVLVQRALRKLQRAYANRNTSLEVRRAGEAWALQVRSEYLEVAHKVTPVDIPARSLRVLALVAFHQPIRQSVLARMVGEIAYTEVKVLKELGFVHAVSKASTLELTTTSRFAEYFGLESTDHDKIRERLAQKLGIPLSAIPAPPPDVENAAARPDGGPGAAPPDGGANPSAVVGPSAGGSELPAE